MAVRRVIQIMVAVVLLGACQSSPATKTAAVGLAQTTSVPATGATPITEPVVARARLQSILLGPADLPPRFVAAPATDDGADALSLLACGEGVVSRPGARTEAGAVLTRATDNVRVVELVAAYASAGAAAVPLASLRALGARCLQAGVTPVQPLAVGEEVAGLRVAAAGKVFEVALIREGPLVAAVIAVGRLPIPTTTWNAVVQAAGTKLAVGTGG